METQKIPSLLEIFRIFEQERLPFYDSDDLPIISYCIYCLPLCKEFVKKGINIGGLYEGGNIFHFIAESGNLDELKYALQFPIDINKADNRGCTPLDLALYKGNTEVADYLKEMHAQMNT